MLGVTHKDHWSSLGVAEGGRELGNVKEEAWQETEIGSALRIRTQ